MERNVFEAFSTFSEKLKRFTKAGEKERVQSPEKTELLQEELKIRQERFESSVAANYRIYKSPFETLGKDSERAASIDKDEQALFKAYNLYKSVAGLNSENAEEVGATYISYVEIATPLARKKSYTEGGFFVYLWLWLYFEKNCREFFPFFETDGAKTKLSFDVFKDAPPDAKTKEIFEIVRRDFYS